MNCLDWQKYPDTEPEVQHISTFEDYQSIAVLVSTKGDRLQMARFYISHEDDEPRTRRWVTDCSEGWDITDFVDVWTYVAAPSV